MATNESNKPRPRGRPRSDTAGAREAFDSVQRYRERENLSVNALAVRCGMTPSTVSRALANRDSARFTPTLKTLYSIAENRGANAKISPAMKRLAAYKGPGEAAVKRLLNDVEDLITLLSTLRR
jgi:transcriptional regulator with XRE-family HTH domain